jgi:hypothetical protein
MKKYENDFLHLLLFGLLILALFSSCSEQQKAKINESVILVDSIKTFTNNNDTNDTIVKDSMFIKVNSLIESTKNSENKIKDIKILKKENTTLKKELKETKDELEIVKEKLESDSVVKKKKKSFIQKIVETIKKDTL